MSSKYPVGPTETERCIESLLTIFQRYAGRDGDGKTLARNEFMIFMNTELGSIMKNHKDPSILNRVMIALDRNGDGEMDFSEFLNLIGILASACHEQVLSTTGSHKKP